MAASTAFLSAAEEVHHADLAVVYEDLSRKSQAWFVRTLPSEPFSEVLAEIPDPLVEEALDYLQPSQQREVLEELPDDDRVDLLQDVEDEQKREACKMWQSGNLTTTFQFFKSSYLIITYNFFYLLS